jgi:hypothetical protein
METMERTPGALEHEELFNLAADGDASIFARHGFDDALFVAVAEKGVWVWLAVDGHARPAVLDDFDVRGVDVRVLLDEVGAEDGGEFLGGRDGVLFCEDVARLLLGVGGYDDGVVGVGVAADS